MSNHVRRLEDEMDKLRKRIEENPDEEAMLNLARKMKADHDTVQEAVQYAEISEKDKQKLLRLARSL